MRHSMSSEQFQKPTSGLMPSTYREAGFTLIELMIVVVIIAVLAGIAYASYQNQVVNSRRSAAAVCLQEKAQLLERFYTTNMTYVGFPEASLTNACNADLEPFYAFGRSGALAAKSFQLQAAPEGMQQRDTKCATLSLNSQGVQGESGTASSASECW
jgi:type IV pilus assembly protein PilE